MKVQSASIKLIHRTSKVLADGSSPIYLRCSFNGMKEVSTGCSCTAKYWDKKNECIRKGYPNYASINQLIQQMKNDAIKRRNEYEINGIAYTPAMVLQQKVVQTVSNDNLEAMIGRYTAHLSPTTKKTWKAFLNSFNRFRKIETILEVDLECIKAYASFLENSGMKESTIKMTLSKLAALCRYAVEEGIIKESPFKRWNYGKKYKLASSCIYIHHRTIEVMKEMFMNEVIEEKNGLWRYKDESDLKLIDRTSPLFARYFWLCGLLFNGLAPIDLCQLRIEDMDVRTIKGTNYYCWDLKRQKTGIDVKIRIKTDSIYNAVMVRTFLMWRKGYLLPILDGVENDKLKIYKKVSNWLSNHVDVLREWLKEVNEEIIKRNVENNDNIPLAPLEATYYTYRHSFAQMYLAKGGNILNLATLLGRSMDTISVYVKSLNMDDDLADAVDIL